MPKHILIVDDQADLLLLMRRSLEMEGYRVTQASDGPAALAAVAAHVPDLIVSDVMMPVMDGFALIEQLWTNPGLRDVPVILLTAAAAVEKVEKRAGAIGVDLLQKPFSPRRLLGVVRETLERRTAQAARPATGGPRALDRGALRTRIDSVVAGGGAGTPGVLVTDRTGTTRVRDAWAVTFHECAAEALREQERCALLVARLEGQGDTATLASELAALWGDEHVPCWVGNQDLVVFAPGADRGGVTALARRLQERLAGLATPGSGPVAVRCAVTSYSPGGAPDDGQLEVIGDLATPPPGW